MASSPDNEDDSLIVILGTSPGGSMVEKSNGTTNGDLERSQIEDAMRSLSNEANMAFKAQFNLGESPSPASMMVASTIITEDRSTEELQKRFGDLLDENFVLKETLKQNNDSMKEQFILIASCQEDMLKTHRLHKEKFDETRELVERLRQENKQLKMDISRLAEGEQNSIGQKKLSGFELVTSVEEDTIEKLSSQLELVEKQRRQLIVDNEKLSWQKESLEHIVDSMNKERDDAKKKLHKVELQLSTMENDHAQEVSKLHCIISDLQNKMKTQSVNTSPEEVSKRDVYIQKLEGKMSLLQNELKKAQIKILDLENIKLEFSQHKSNVSETVKMYKDQIQELKDRIKEVQTTVFQPIRVSVSEPSSSSEFLNNVKLYDRTLKHLADYLNSLSNGLSDSLAHTLGVVSSIQDVKIDRGSVDKVKCGVGELKTLIATQHSNVVSNVAHVRSTLSTFEGIFKDHNELLKRSVTNTDTVQAPCVQQLTEALVARGQQVSELLEELAAVKARTDDADLLRAQVDLYKSDFEAERESREKMASEKENLLADLRVAQKKIQDLTTQLEELRVLSPSLHKSITSPRPRSAGKPAPTTTARTAPATAVAANAVRKKKRTEKSVVEAASRETTPPPAKYICPACDGSFRTYMMLERHVHECLL
nr:NF-kappa-B essential modulator-like [Danaus plexippus plexippus]